jgi:hypothetical protein
MGEPENSEVGEQPCEAGLRLALITCVLNDHGPCVADVGAFQPEAAGGADLPSWAASQLSALGW